METSFKSWLETLEDQGFEKTKEIILGFLNLDPHNGLSANLDELGRQKILTQLSNLGEFMEHPNRAGIQAAIMNNQAKTVGDVVRMMSLKG